MLAPLRTIFALIAALAAITVPAMAVDLTHVAFIQVRAEPASIPVGHAAFCNVRPAECAPHRDIVPYMSIDETRWSEMLAVNAHYNDTIIPMSDADLYGIEEFWTYPRGYGDCEDYALAKRRALIELGWPASVLLISVVREPSGTGHAVLLVRTDRGDFVLDNQEGLVKLWNETSYQFVKRQDQAHAGRWVDMLDGRDIAVVATAGVGN